MWPAKSDETGTAAGAMVEASFPLETVMPWFAWLFLALAFGLVIGSLLLLRDSADKMPLSEEELQRMREREAELQAKAREDDGEDE